MSDELPLGDWVTTGSGDRVSMAMVKARLTKQILHRQKVSWGRMSPDQRNKMLYEAYLAMDRDIVKDGSSPVFQAGLSPYTFVNEPIKIGNFVTSYGNLFTRLYLACKEAEGNMPLGGEE